MCGGLSVAVCRQPDSIQAVSIRKLTDGQEDRPGGDADPVFGLRSEGLPVHPLRNADERKFAVR